MASVLASPTLSADEAAAYLGVRPQTLAVWRTTGRYGLRYVKCGRLIRYRIADLDAWLQSRTATSTGELANADI